MKKTYKEIDGFFSFEPFYNFICKNYIKESMNIVEIGAFKGKSTSFMASYIKNFNVNFYVVDNWKGSDEHQSLGNIKNLFEEFKSNMEQCELLDVIKIVKKDSVEASALFEDNFFDFVFIDAAHDYVNVKNDINAWYPKVKKNGIIGGDDYSLECWPEVVKAADEILGNEIQQNFKPAWYCYKS